MEDLCEVVVGGEQLLEREAELTALGAAVEAARGSRGGVVLIEGAPGAGKSALCRAAAELAVGRGVVVLDATGAEIEHKLPFGVARQLLGEPSRPAAPAGGVALIERYAQQLMRRLYPDPDRPETQPHLVVVDDAQWADPFSLQLIGHLARRLDRLPVSLVVSTRSGEEMPLELVAELLRQPGTERLEPAPLSREGAGELLAELVAPEVDAAVVEACMEASGGSPFYLTEIARELARLGEAADAEAVREAAPGTVMRAVMARLAALGEGETRLAQAVAILGDGWGLAEASALAELDSAAAGRAADRLAGASLLESGEPLRLCHPLIGSAMRADMGSFLLATFHRRAAEVLAEAGAEPDRVAAQLLHSQPGADAEAARRLREAGERARDRGEAETAVRLLGRALAEPPPEAERPELLLELAEAEATAGHAVSLQRLTSALDGLADPRRRARAAAGLARTLHHAGEFGRAAEVADRGREELRRMPGGAAAADGDAVLADALGAAWIAAAMLHPPLHGELMERLGPPIEAARAGELPADPGLRALLAGWLVSWDEDPRLVRELAVAAFERDPLVDGDARGAALGFAAVALLCLDELELLDEHLVRAIEAATRRGAVIAAAVARNFLGWSALHQGRLDRALTEAEAALEFHRFGWTPSPWSAPTLTRALAERGELAEAEATLEAAEAVEGDRAEGILLLEVRAELELALERPGDALAHALEAGSRVEGEFGTTSSRFYAWLRLAAEAAARAGDTERAAELAADAVERARAGGVARQLGDSLRVAGLVAGGERGLELLEEAVAVLADSPSELERARALVALGSLERRTGNRRRAAERLSEALELADQLGAVRLVEQCRIELRSLGLRPRRAARTGTDSLTPTERRVAELAARGLSTPQISHQLFVTRKTVESHLTQIYRKLEIAGRGELPAALETGSAVAGKDD